MTVSTHPKQSYIPWGQIQYYKVACSLPSTAEEKPLLFTNSTTNFHQKLTENRKVKNLVCRHIYLRYLKTFTNQNMQLTFKDVI